MITKAEVEKAQSEWAAALIQIGSLKGDFELCVRRAQSELLRLYAFDLGPVLFKPTLAKEKAFRTDLEGALSYFVGGNPQYSEDKGFALQGWKDIRFENASMILEERAALVMGHYFFLDQEEVETKVEFTLGYIKDSQGQLRIRLHHSSKP